MNLLFYFSNIAFTLFFFPFLPQTATSLADASLQRSAAEKYRDEQELVAARRREQARYASRPPPGRHSRFGGTYILQNVKSISDKDIICHQSIERAFAMDFDRDKNKQKRSHRIVKEQPSAERRSAFSIRCINVLMVAGTIWACMRRGSTAHHKRPKAPNRNNNNIAQTNGGSLPASYAVALHQPATNLIKFPFSILNFTCSSVDAALKSQLVFGIWL